MATGYLHGIKIEENPEGAPSIAPIRTSVIGLVGTASDGDDVPGMNEPFLIAKPSDASRLLGKIVSGQESTSNTMLRSIEAINFQTSPLIVCIRVASADAAAGNLSEGTGVYALLKAQSKVGFTPKILIAPTFAHLAEVKTALLLVAEKLRAEALIDGSIDNKINDIIDVAKNSDSSRFYLSYPWVEGEGSSGDLPLSPFIAGLIAKNDAENGFWSSPSNKELRGIKRLKRDIGWSLSDPDSEANLLNEKGIATVIRHNGYRLWGSRNLGKGDKTNSANKFLNVRRITDTINDSVALSSMWAVDQDITKNYVQDVLESVNNYLRNLRSNGAILNGTAWADPKDNPPDNIKNGQIIFSFDYSPVYPGEQIKFKSILTDKYLKEVFE